MEEGLYDRVKGSKLSLIISDFDRVPFKKVLKLILTLNDLYKSIGGDSLKIGEGISLEEATENESPYELHGRTPFANLRKSLKPTPITHYAPREQVYATIEEYVKPEIADRIRQELDQKYPTEIWLNKFPTIGAFDILINKNIENFKSR
jgi:hypothetical protein